MHIIITGIHVEVTEAMSRYAEEKFRTLEKYIHNDSSAKLVVELQKTTEHHTHGNIFQAEAQLHIRGNNATCRTSQDDLYKAIDVLKDMLIREVASYKDKERSVMRRGAHKVKTLLKRLID